MLKEIDNGGAKQSPTFVFSALPRKQESLIQKEGDENGKDRYCFVAFVSDADCRQC